jgi:hypothetical protein
VFLKGDATRLPLADQSVDLVLGSPPYIDARLYLEAGRDLGVSRKLGSWVEWMLDVTAEAVRVSRGLVIWICAGVTRRWCYQPGPEGLLYEWVKRGGIAWRPQYWHRDGIPGSGGRRLNCSLCSGDGCDECDGGLSNDPEDAPQWVRANVEYAMAFVGDRGRVPWANASVNGHAPKRAPGGEMSHMLTNGTRVNQWGHPIDSGATVTDGDFTRRANGVKKTTRRCTRGKKGGDTLQETKYVPPVMANPGQLISGIPVGGGLMGHDLAHKNEAPYPQALAERFIASCCRPGGIVLDPFSGSGTTVAAARVLQRHGLGLDLRASQVLLGMARCDEIQVNLFA